MQREQSRPFTGRLKENKRCIKNVFTTIFKTEPYQQLKKRLGCANTGFHAVVCRILWPLK